MTVFKRLLSKYENLSQPVKASLWFTVCNLIQKGIALLCTPIFTRLLTTKQYGAYTVYQSWYQIIAIFATLMLSAGIFNNGLTKYPEKKKEFASSLLGLSTTATFVLFSIYIVSMEFWNKLFGLSSLFVFAMFFQLLFEPPYLFWCTEQRYDFKYKNLIITTLFIAFGSPILGIIAVLSTTYKAEARVVSFVLIQVIVGLFFYVKIFKNGKKFYDSFFWKYALSFNIPLIPHYLSMVILNQSDRIMIDEMIGTSEAAIYGIAYTLAMMMTIVTNAINNSFIPYKYQNLKNCNFEGIRKTSKSLLALVAGISIVAMSFAPELIRIFATEEYLDAIWVMPPVAASVYFLFLYPLFANIEFYFEKTKFIMFASCSGAILNVLLNYVFIKIFGYYAAGYTTLVCYILFAFAHYVAHKRIISTSLEVNQIYDIKYIVLLSVFVLIMMGMMILGYIFSIVRYAFIGVFVVLCAFNYKKIYNLVISKIKMM